MAVEKLSDGIRKFAADAVKLERMLVVGAPHSGAELEGSAGSWGGQLPWPKGSGPPPAAAPAGGRGHVHAASHALPCSLSRTACSAQKTENRATPEPGHRSGPSELGRLHMPGDESFFFFLTSRGRDGSQSLHKICLINSRSHLCPGAQLRGRGWRHLVGTFGVCGLSSCCSGDPPQGERVGGSPPTPPARPRSVQREPGVRNRPVEAKGPSTDAQRPLGRIPRTGAARH